MKTNREHFRFYTSAMKTSNSMRLPIITCAWTIDELHHEKETERTPPKPIVVRSKLGNPESEYTLLLDDHSYLLSSAREYLTFPSIDAAANFLVGHNIHEFNVDLACTALCSGTPPTTSPTIPFEKDGIMYFITRKEIDSK